MKLGYSKRKECQSFLSWLCYEWDMPHGWQGPYIQLREVGIRIIGIEVTWWKRLTA